MSQSVRYRPSPTLARFHASPAFVRGVMGPVGSGKSAAMCVELLSRAMRQRPGPDGVRRSRFAVVRNTLPELKTTTLKTWEDWIPEPVCPLKTSPPVTGRMRARLPDGTRLDMETLFLGLDRPGDARKLLSLELTGAWVNEAREVPREVVDGLTGRVGRYPPKRLGGPSWSGIVMDTNPPDEEHWWYRLAEEERPEGWEFFRQPPALLEQGGRYLPNPQAENAGNQPLGFDYWLRQARGKPREWVRVYLLGAYGSVHSGQPVYPEFDDARHTAPRPLAPYPGLPLILGWDFGLTPACVVAQVSPRGQLRILSEVASEDMGIRRFARETVRPLLARSYPGFRLTSVGDPAGSSRAQTDERTCMDELAAARIPTRPARTNQFLARREAVAGFLARRIDGDPGFLLSPECTVLRRGFLGGYRFGTGTERPEKNRFSHIHDALQYAALAAEQGRSRPCRSPRAAQGPADGTAGY